MYKQQTLQFLVLMFSFCFICCTSEPTTGTIVVKKNPYKIGQDLFKANCASCHKIQSKLVGPALQDATKKYEKEWLYKWVRNSQELINSGDSQAVKIYNEYNKTVQTPFPHLTDQEIDAIFLYIDSGYIHQTPPPVMPVN